MILEKLKINLRIAFFQVSGKLKLLSWKEAWCNYICMALTSQMTCISLTFLEINVFSSE